VSRVTGRHKTLIVTRSLYSYTTSRFGESQEIVEKLVKMRRTSRTRHAIFLLGLFTRAHLKCTEHAHTFFYRSQQHNQPISLSRLPEKCTPV
jgi:hypothetical protein